jgi:SAM domain (Sterile alpha motif)
MQQIADWLKKLGMSEYAELFAENRIDFSVLRDLTDRSKDKGAFGGSRYFLRLGPPFLQDAVADVADGSNSEVVSHSRRVRSTPMNRHRQTGADWSVSCQMETHAPQQQHLHSPLIMRRV